MRDSEETVHELQPPASHVFGRLSAEEAARVSAATTEVADTAQETADPEDGRSWIIEGGLWGTEDLQLEKMVGVGLLVGTADTRRNAIDGFNCVVGAVSETDKAELDRSKMCFVFASRARAHEFALHGAAEMLFSEEEAENRMKSAALQ